MYRHNDTRQRAMELREQGLSYRDIARQLDVSFQRVAQICGVGDPSYARPVGDTCIYKNIREWMNTNKVSRAEFLRRMGMTADAENSCRLGRVLRGESQPRKDYIERMLKVTGLTFEQLFACN